MILSDANSRMGQLNLFLLPLRRSKMLRNHTERCRTTSLESNGGGAYEIFARGRHIRRQSRAPKRLNRQLGLTCVVRTTEDDKISLLNGTGAIKFLPTIRMRLRLYDALWMERFR
jgi:hypothetical protein